MAANSPAGWSVFRGDNVVSQGSVNSVGAALTLFGDAVTDDAITFSRDAGGNILANGGEDRSFHEAKLVTARFFAERVMPDSSSLRHKIEAGAESLMALPAEAF